VNESDDNQAYFSRRAVAEAWSRDAELYPAEHHIIESHFPPPGARILDIGCGAGRTTAALIALGYRVTAIDYSPDMVSEARTRVSGGEILQMDATILAFPDRSFDAVLFSFNGLDGIYPASLRRRALGEMARVVRPPGVLYYTSHNWLGALGRSGGSGLAAGFRRKSGFLLTQRPRPFASGYGVYRDDFGEQVLYHRSPFSQLRIASGLGLNVRAVYGSTRFKDPDWRTALTGHGRSMPHQMDLLRIALTCPHVHYVLKTRAA
jgi:SAM-dependent methyltransferase